MRFTGLEAAPHFVVNGWRCAYRLQVRWIFHCHRSQPTYPSHRTPCQDGGCNRKFRTNGFWAWNDL